ncbi:MAG TPA: phosphoribosylanthranilate isomerase [Thermodesulfobacteriota bacterium]|nr:phosphoribosylanthranilate isomerase [Thermodesulfobacteriota bacterium]
MTKVKICGITNYKDASKSLDYGADALGFIFYKKSKRYIEPSEALNIIKQLPPFVTKVGVFVNSSYTNITKISKTLSINAIQLHGDETPAFCKRFLPVVIKALRIKDHQDLEKVDSFGTQAILFDTYSSADYGGTGRVFDWNILRKLKTDKKIILSGGLNPQNVGMAVKTVKPYAVDVSSGVEKSAGIKDHKKIKEFIEVVKNAK